MDAAQLVTTAPNPRIPRFSAGDTVRVNFRIREGERERIQAFQGVVIRLQNGTGPAANFTVRRISGGIGVERIFPLHSPLVESLEVTRYGSVRRAKLYYLRGLQGRAARIKEQNPLQRRRAAEAAQAAAQAASEALAAQAVAVEEPEEELEAVDEELVDGPDEQTVDEASDEPEDAPVDEVEDQEPEEPVAEEPAEEEPTEEEAAEEEPAEEEAAEEPEQEAEEEPPDDSGEDSAETEEK